MLPGAWAGRCEQYAGAMLVTARLPGCLLMALAPAPHSARERQTISVDCHAPVATALRTMVATVRAAGDTAPPPGRLFSRSSAPATTRLRCTALLGLLMFFEGG